MTEKVKIRRFTMDDFDAVVEYSRRAYGWPDEKSAGGELELMYNSILSLHKSEPEGMFVAECGGRVVGNCFATSDGLTSAEGSLHYVAVDPRYQGKGIGGKLTDRCFAYLRTKGMKTVRLGTDRPLAMRFYMKYGFEIVGWSVEMDVAGRRKPRTMTGRLLRLIEEYAAFRFTFRNTHAMREKIEAILARRLSDARKIKELLKVAAAHRLWPPMPEDSSRFKAQARKILSGRKAASSGPRTRRKS